MECWPLLMRCGAPVNVCNCKYVVCSAVTGDRQWPIWSSCFGHKSWFTLTILLLLPGCGCAWPGCRPGTAPSCDTGHGETSTVPASGLCCDIVYFIIFFVTKMVHSIVTVFFRICCLADMWLYYYKLRMVAGLCWCSAVQGKLPFCDCKYVVCSTVISSHQDKAHAAENKLYFYNKYRVSHNTGLTFFVFLSVYFHPKCRSWGSFEKFRKFANLFAF